jgi:hypothetical protein
VFRRYPPSRWTGLQGIVEPIQPAVVGAVRLVRLVASAVGRLESQILREPARWPDGDHGVGVPVAAVHDTFGSTISTPGRGEHEQAGRAETEDENQARHVWPYAARTTGVSGRRLNDRRTGAIFLMAACRTSATRRQPQWRTPIMSRDLEIPFPPPHLSPRGRVEPPWVPIVSRWEYRDLVRDEIAPPTEPELNVLGQEGWELVGVAVAGSQIHFYFKRERPG